MIVARVKAGMERAKAEQAAGTGMLKVAKDLGEGTGTVPRFSA